MPRFEARGVDYAYQSTGPPGAERTIVFLHGLLVSSDIWTSQTSLFSRSRRVLAVDWPGHGASPPLSSPVCIGDLSEAVISLLDDLGVRRTALVGLSLGGIVALDAAFRFPERVESMALVSTPRTAETEAQRARHLETLDAAVRIGQTAILKGIALRLFGATTRRERPELVATWLERAARLDLASVRRLSEAALDRREALAFGALSPRTLVVRGDEDNLLPRSDTEALAEGLEEASLVAVRGSGHLVPLEAPGALSDALASFFELGGI